MEKKAAVTYHHYCTKAQAYTFTRFKNTLVQSRNGASLCRQMPCNIKNPEAITSRLHIPRFFRGLLQMFRWMDLGTFEVRLKYLVV